MQLLSFFNSLYYLGNTLHTFNANSYVFEASFFQNSFCNIPILNVLEESVEFRTIQNLEVRKKATLINEHELFLTAAILKFAETNNNWATFFQKNSKIVENTGDFSKTLY